MLTFIGKIIEIIISNVVALLVFYLVYQVGVSVVPMLAEYYKIPLFIDIVFLLYQDIKILRRK